MPRRTPFCLALIASLALVACSRTAPEPTAPAELKEAAQQAVQEAKDAVTDAVAEAAERKAQALLLEQRMNADGSKLKVSLGADGDMRTEGVDKDGKPVLVHQRVKDISAAEVGLPLYPGATVTDEGGSRIRNDKAMNWILPLASPDAADKVSSFYRAEFAKLAGVKERMELPSDKPGGLHLMAIYPSEAEGLSVMVKPLEAGGSEILISRSKPH